MAKQDYDDFSADYDRFVDWEARLAQELPFLKDQLEIISKSSDHTVRVLDAACGTGMHAIALAREGYRMGGADISPQMIKKAEENARAAGVDPYFYSAGFGGLQTVFADSHLLPFDALLCLGNSLPHLLTPSDILDALKDMANCLRPGGLLLIQNRNFDAVMAEKQRWLGTQSHREGENEWLFLRFYDFDQDGLITFNIVRLSREGGGDWQANISVTRLLPISQEMLVSLVKQAGFGDITCFGKLAQEAFDPQKSSNLVLTARKK